MTIPLSVLTRLAKKSDHSRNSHASIVVKGGSILATGYNFGTTHSEVMALNHIWPNKRKGVSIINIMITTKKGIIGNSRPCAECREYLRHNKVRKVIYSDGLIFREEKV